MNCNRKLKIALVTNMCPHYRIGAFESLHRKYDIDFYFFSDGKEKHFLQEGGVHGGNFKYRYLAGFILFGQRITPALIFHLIKKKYDIVIKCTNGRFALPVTFIVSKLLRKRFILWHSFWHDRDTWSHKYVILPCYKIIWRYSDAILTYGSHGTKYLVQYGVNPGKIFEAWQSVNNSLYSKPPDQIQINSLKQKLKIEGKKVVLFVGRLDKEKGIEYLIEAFAQLRVQNSILLLVGNGSNIDDLKAECRKFGVEDKTRFEGFVKYTELYLRYAVADVFVLPSVTTRFFKEPWGLVVNEAMNQGVPVIATNAVGAAVGGLIDNGITGFVINERDSDDMASVLNYILDKTELRKKMSKNCKETISVWDYHKMIGGFVSAIEYVRRID